MPVNANHVTGQSITATDMNALASLANTNEAGLVAASSTYPARAGGSSPVAAKQPFFNVRDYGAKGDGTTDDSAAIASAVAAAAGSGTVFIPVGTYLADLSLSDYVRVAGAGFNSVIKGRLLWASFNIVSDLKIGVAGTGSSNGVLNAHDTLIERVYFSGGSSVACIYMNDTTAKDIAFVDCIIADNASGGNGVQIIDKGTAAKHYENITFTRCRFRNNARMNFECVQRSDAGYPVVSGYRNVSLYDCVFEQAGNINVSYDAGLYADGLPVNGSVRTSGYSTVKGCKIVAAAGPGYALEQAGCVHMLIEGNDISNTSTSELLSTTQVGSGPSYNRIIGNKFVSSSTADVTVAGANNVIEGNIIRTGGRLRHNPMADSFVVGNYVETTGATAVSIENGFGITYMNNILRGGSGQVVLNIGTSAVNNAFINNEIYSYNVGIDVRDGVYVATRGNRTRVGNGTNARTEDNLNALTGENHLGNGFTDPAAGLPAGLKVSSTVAGSVALAAGAGTSTTMPLVVSGIAGQSVDLIRVAASSGGGAIVRVHGLGGLCPGNGTASGGALWSGSGAPSNSLGGSGDFYFRTDTPTTANQRFYVNTGGAWTGIA